MEITKYNWLKVRNRPGIPGSATSSLLVLLMLLAGCKEHVKTQEKSDEDQSTAYELKIAYNVLVDAEKDNYDVFLMDLDGSNKTNITNLKGVEWCYFAYGDTIYYVSDQDTLSRNYFLYRMQADGSQKEKVSPIRLADSWQSARKNGSELIVRPHSSIADAFFIIGSDGSVIDSVKPDLAYFTDPLFSRSGNEIIFRGAHKKSKQEDGFRDELYQIGTDGNNLKQLTHYPENDTTAAWYEYKSGPPRWNLPENFITYQSFQHGKYSLFAISPDGKKNWKLTENELNEGWHDWSPEGNYLAIELFDPGQTQFHIGVMDWATRELKVLTDTTYQYQQAPVFIKVYK